MATNAELLKQIELLKQENESLRTKVSNKGGLKSIVMAILMEGRILKDDLIKRMRADGIEEKSLSSGNISSYISYCKKDLEKDGKGLGRDSKGRYYIED